MNEPVYNLHNHTPFSDGAYLIDELCQAHLDYTGVRVAGIGISDHLFCTPSSREIRNARDFQRTFSNETRSYVEQVLEARRRWADRLQVFVGCEINWPLNREHLDSIKPLLDGVDYVLFEYVDWAGLTQLANQARRWPCPIGLAHTDVSEQFPRTSMDQVVRTLANARIFYEINAKFLPLDRHARWFSVLANHKVRVSFATDTHDDLGEIKTLEPMVDFVREHGLTEKLFIPKLRELQPAEMRA